MRKVADLQPQGEQIGSLPKGYSDGHMHVGLSLSVPTCE
jgi:hypothetical protein